METSWTERLHNYASLVKLSHTVFAMPFAASMAIIVAAEQGISALQILGIGLAMVSARTAAMTFNRILDSAYDSKNPRTSRREIPIGRVKLREGYYLLVGSSALFLFSSWILGLHCLVLAPLVLAILCGYSWTKRFTRYSHLVLGLSLALAPGGVWYALTATFALFPVWLMLGVLFWVAGFDIIYSCQDYEFDKSVGLHSIPVSLGLENALRLSVFCHLCSIIFLIIFGISGALGATYYIGLTAFSAIVFSQHQLVSPRDLSQADSAFFIRNGFASALFMVFVAIDQII